MHQECNQNEFFMIISKRCFSDNRKYFKNPESEYRKEKKSPVYENFSLFFGKSDF